MKDETHKYGSKQRPREYSNPPENGDRRHVDTSQPGYNTGEAGGGCQVPFIIPKIFWVNPNGLGGDFPSQWGFSIVVVDTCQTPNLASQE